MNKERQIRYNWRRSKNNQECNEWWILIINQNREIEELQPKIYNLFSPIEEELEIIEGVVKKTGLRYKLLNFESRKKVERSQLKKIYKKVVKDIKIYTRENSDGLANYLIGQFES